MTLILNKRVREQEALENSKAMLQDRPRINPISKVLAKKVIKRKLRK
jgi:hypothetical protein